jgi:hypothetical protein
LVLSLVRGNDPATDALDAAFATVALISTVQVGNGLVQQRYNFLIGKVGTA